MPWSTLAVVFGSWLVLLVLTVLYHAVWSKRRDYGDREGKR